MKALLRFRTHNQRVDFENDLAQLVTDYEMTPVHLEAVPQLLRDLTPADRFAIIETADAPGPIDAATITSLALDGHRVVAISTGRTIK